MQALEIFNKVYEKTGEDYGYFSEQYLYTPNQPKLEHYQTDNNFCARWNNVNDNFSMPLDLLVNGSVVSFSKKIISRF